MRTQQSNGHTNGNGHIPTRADVMKRGRAAMADIDVEEAPPKRRGRPPKAKFGQAPEVIEMPTTGKTKAKGKAKGKSDEAVTVPPLETGKVTFTVHGLSSLIVHRFGEKSRKQMEDNQQGVARHKKAPKVPEEEFRSSLYVINDKKGIYGFPASGFKKAMVSACRYAEGFTMTKALGSFHVMGDLLQIKGPKPIMRTDVVRVGKFGSKTSDIRYRGEFKDWSIDVEILYNQRVVSKEILAHLLHLAGFSVGIGEWRPEKGGQFGMFALD
jgi:hypothetical protein